MVTTLPLEDLGATPRERRLLGRLGLILAAVVLGAGSGISVYAWASTRINAVDAKIEGHLGEVRALRPQMDEYVKEERAARCSIAVNVYALCVRTGVRCAPVEARCGNGGR